MGLSVSKCSSVNETVRKLQVLSYKKTGNFEIEDINVKISKTRVKLLLSIMFCRIVISRG